MSVGYFMEDRLQLTDSIKCTDISNNIEIEQKCFFFKYLFVLHLIWVAAMTWKLIYNIVVLSSSFQLLHTLPYSVFICLRLLVLSVLSYLCVCITHFGRQLFSIFFVGRLDAKKSIEWKIKKRDWSYSIKKKTIFHSFRYICVLAPKNM